MDKLPLISVIIPMYNTEKYIEDCLESLLAQTFKDFEVIVVDDCSTDNSTKIVEDYVSKFAHNQISIRILRRSENSGCCGTPRNEGLKVARGKYIYFMDSDDFIVSKTLEIFYHVASETQADVVISTKYFLSNGQGKDFLNNLEPVGDLKDTLTGFVTEDLAQRVKLYLESAGGGILFGGVWLCFVKHDFLISNKINFLPVNQEDSIWSFELICLAKKIFFLPYFCYVYRFLNPGSIVSVAYDNNLTTKTIYKKFERIIKGIKHVDNFMSRIEFFQKNPFERFSVIDFMIQQNLQWIYNSYPEASPLQIYKIFKEACKEETGNFDVLISYFLTLSIVLLRENLILKEKIKQLEELNAQNILQE